MCNDEDELYRRSTTGMCLTETGFVHVVDLLLCRGSSSSRFFFLSFFLSSSSPALVHHYIELEPLRVKFHVNNLSTSAWNSSL